MRTIYRDISELTKIWGFVSDYLELAALNKDFDIQRDSLFGAAYVMNEALRGIDEFEDKANDRWNAMRDELFTLRKKAA